MAKIGNKNVKVLRQQLNEVTGILVELTRKMRIDGTMGYYVVATDTNTGYHIAIKGGRGIQDAYQLYMVASGKNLNYPFRAQ